MSGRASGTGTGGTARVLLAAAALFLALSVLVWWHVWSTHPTAVTTCGCGDASVFTWDMAWPAYAVAHAHDPFYSTALFHGTGFNVLANTTVLAVGTALVPVTWLFGPVAALNVGATLVPVLSALAMCWLLLRWVSWAPAAVAGGLLYGFSPFVLGGLSSGWLTTLLVVPPLVVACLDELLARRRRRPAAVGAVLGVLLAVQFFVSTEMLAITVVVGAAALALVVGRAVLVDRGGLRRAAPHVAAGLGTAAGVAGVLLAYPLWFALAGPDHLGGTIWPGMPAGFYGVSLPDLWRLPPTPLQAVRAQHLAGGYQGTPLPPSTYLGLGVLAVVAVGVAVWWRDRRLRLFAATGVVAALLCLSPYAAGNGFWVPWRVLAHVPVVRNVLPVRFAAMVVLCAAVVVALTADHAVAAARRGTAARLGGHAAGAAVVLAAALPIAFPLARTVPMTVEPVVLPQWFARAAPALPGHQVVLVYPVPFGGIQSSLTWQAVDGLHFAMAGGAGPQGVASRAGPERAGFEALAAVSDPFAPPPAGTAATVPAVRRALDGWGVTTVVVPDQPDLPRYERGHHVALAVALFTAALGEAPRHEDRAWVWSRSSRPAPAAVTVPRGTLATCAGEGAARPVAVGAVPGCVLAHAT